MTTLPCGCFRAFHFFLFFETPDCLLQVFLTFGLLFSKLSDNKSSALANVHLSLRLNSQASVSIHLIGFPSCRPRAPCQINLSQWLLVGYYCDYWTLLAYKEVHLQRTDCPLARCRPVSWPVWSPASGRNSLLTEVRLSLYPPSFMKALW